MSDIAFERPRFSVSQGMVFITDRDRIVKADALQIHTDEIDAATAEGGGKGAGKKAGK